VPTLYMIGLSFHESPAVRFDGLIGPPRPPRAEAQGCFSDCGTPTSRTGPIVLASRWAGVLRAFAFDGFLG